MWYVHPKKLGRYELVAVLGKGAMGVVYEGRDPNLDRRVAIKTIMVDDLAPTAAAEYEHRFRTEARSAARLQHPNIVTVYDSDRDGDTAFLVMEFIHGEDLKQHLDRGERFTPAESLRLMLDLLAALDFAHRQGVVHRDVKPANLLIEPGGRLKLTDFGVARVTGEATRTQGSMIGTLKYMSPEQVQGLKVDTRADQFSAAVVAYQLFTGMRPFDGDNDFSIIHQIIGHEPASPSSIAPDLPAGFDAALARAMAKDREQRYPSIGEFSAALQEVFSAAGIVPVPHAPIRGGLPPAPAPLPQAVRTIPGAPIAQEMELEYWRDVRNTTDRRELEGFLARFPHGIYAELARKRLQRLVSEPDPDQTVLQGMTRPPGSTAAGLPNASAVAGQAAVQSAVPAPAAAGSQVATAPLPPADAPAPPRAASESLAAAPAPSTAAQASSGAAPAPSAAAPALAAAPAARARAPEGRASASHRWLWPGLAAGVLGLAVAAAVLMGRDKAEAPAAAAATPATPVQVAVPAAAEPAASTPLPAPIAAAPASSPAVPASEAAARAPAAGASRAQQAARATTRRGASAPASAGGTVSTPPVAGEQSPRDAPGAVTSATAAATASPVNAARTMSPAEACKDKVFLLKTFCLQSECAKPGHQNFPACVRLREEEKMREESKIRN